jgi:hypothetical protein
MFAQIPQSLYRRERDFARLEDNAFWSKFRHGTHAKFSRNDTFPRIQRRRYYGVDESEENVVVLKTTSDVFSLFYIHITSTSRNLIKSVTKGMTMHGIQ